MNAAQPWLAFARRQASLQYFTSAQFLAQCLRQLEQHPLAERIVAVFPTLVFGGRVDGGGFGYCHRWRAIDLRA